MSYLRVALLAVLVIAGELALFGMIVRRQVRHKRNFYQILRERHPDLSVSVVTAGATLRSSLAAVRDQNRQLEERASSDHELSVFLARDKRNRIYARLCAVLILATSILAVVLFGAT